MSHEANAVQLAVELADVLAEFRCSADDAERLDETGWAMADAIVRHRRHRSETVGFSHTPGSLTRSATIAVLRYRERADDPFTGFPTGRQP